MTETIECYTITLDESSSSNTPTYVRPNHSSDVVTWTSMGRCKTKAAQGSIIDK